MASAAAVEESLDFDFFETPRPDNGSEFAPSKSPSKPPKFPDLSPNEGLLSSPKSNNIKEHVSPRKPAASPTYSSDSYSSDSASDTNASGAREEKSKRTASNRQSRSSLSNSSFSSSGSRKNSQSSVSSVTSDSVRKGSRVQEQDLPRRGKSRQGDDEPSSSAYSGGEGSSDSHSVSRDDSDSARKNSGCRKKGRQMQKQAWDTQQAECSKDVEKKTHSRNRPVTAKIKKVSSSSALTKNNRAERHQRSRSGSDSDITDVSPIDSPRLGASGDDGKSRKFKAMPLDGPDPDSVDDGGPAKGEGRSNLDLEILMKAVGELEKQKRVQANSRRVAFAPIGGSRDRQNYTFDQQQTRNIERENQRLLNEIVRRVSSNNDQRKQFYASPATAYKLTPSAVNRERDMKRIESENMAFLKRLQKVKATTTICRDHQLRQYENTTLHGVPISALHPLPGRGLGSGNSRGRRTPGAGTSGQDSASSLGPRTRSMTSIHSAASSVRSSKRGSRPGSATKRLDTRPAWNDRW